MRVRPAGRARRRPSFGGTLLRWTKGAVLALGLAAAVRCSDSSAAPRLAIPRSASFAIEPAFDSLPAGGPAIQLGSIRGVMVGAAGDSVVSEAAFQGDSAVLEFTVRFTGRTATFQLTLTAYDLAGNVAYQAIDTVLVRPGKNPPLIPRRLRYAGADADVAAIRVVPDTLDLRPGVPATLGVTGTTREGKRASVPIRVGWLSRADSVATVGATGGVHARALSGTTWIVARSASGAVDSALVRVQPAGP